jgi:hypothetical protein
VFSENLLSPNHKTTAKTLDMLLYAPKNEEENG